MCDLCIQGPNAHISMHIGYMRCQVVLLRTLYKFLNAAIKLLNVDDVIYIHMVVVHLRATSKGNLWYLIVTELYFERTIQ